MIDIQQPVVSATERKELDKLLGLLCLKSAQIIVQGRLGKPVSSKCTPTAGKADQFNLGIKDYPEVQREAKSALAKGAPNFQKSFVVEISLQTKDSETLILEVWSISVSPKFEDARMPQVYKKMSMMLKSLTSVSRVTPAYKISRNQGREYVNCFRIYTGKADISGLSETFKTIRIGTIVTPTGALTLSVAFRTTENLHVSAKKLVSSHPIELSHDHFSTPGNFITSPARACNTLQSRLIGSKGYLSTSRSSSEQQDSPTYYMQASATPSPNDQSAGSLRRAAMFTIGTPPASQSYRSTPPRFVMDSGRRMSDIPFQREPRGMQFDKNRKPFLSNSDQNFSYPLQQQRTQKRNFHVGSIPEQINAQEQGVPDNILNEDSMHSTLTNGDNSFRPISCSPSHKLNQSRSSSIDRVQIPPKSLTRSGHLRKRDSVTALKSNPPTNAKVGFPDNIELTSRLPHCHPSVPTGGRNANLPTEYENAHTDMISAMPVVGAFLGNRRKKKTTSEIKHPFDDLMSGLENERNEMETLKNESTSNTDANSRLTGVDSPSSSSDGSTPTKSGSYRAPSSEDFFLVELDPAFLRNDSAKDLCAFYRQIENAPNLMMFEENHGEETQETLLDLTKQLDDYQNDAADFDDFILELEAF